MSLVNKVTKSLEQQLGDFWNIYLKDYLGVGKGIKKFRPKATGESEEVTGKIKEMLPTIGKKYSAICESVMAVLLKAPGCRLNYTFPLILYS